MLLDGVLAFGGRSVGLRTLGCQPCCTRWSTPTPLGYDAPTLFSVRADVIALLGPSEAVAVLALGLALGFAVLLPWPWPRHAPHVITAVVAAGAILAVTVTAGWVISR